MKKVVLQVDVQGEELDQLNAELRETQKNFVNVQKEATKTAKGVDDVASNGGAIAILDQLTGGLATRLRDAYEASKLFNVSLKSMRTALISTGIGALVVALGTIVAYWDDIVDFISGANVDLEEQHTLLKQNAQLLNDELTVLDAKEKLWKAEGKSLDDLVEKRKQLLRSLRLENQLRLANVIQQRMQLEEDAGKQASWGFVLSRGLFGSRGATEEDKKRLAELQSEAKGLEATIINIVAQLRELENGTTTTSGGGGKAKDPRRKARSVFPETSVVEFEGEGYLEAIQTIADKEIAIIEQKNEAIYEIEQERIDATMLMTAQALGNIGQLVGEQTAVGKALGIAQATIDTYVGANKALAQGGFLGIATASAVITAGLLNVQRIMSTQVPGGFSGVGGGASGAPAIPQPQFNVVGDAGINSVAEAVNGQANTPTRSYVLFQDIQTAQELERNAVESATV